MSVFVASHSLHSIVVDAPAFTITQNSALDSCSGTFVVSSAVVDESTHLEQSRMAPRLSCSRLASNPTLKHLGNLGVSALLVPRCNLPGTELALHVEAALPVCVWGGVWSRVLVPWVKS